MTLQQLQYIVALDTHRHFVKAAESCFVAQPTLTLQVKKLEAQMGLVLFDRSSQPLKPTPAGELFIAKARQILRDVQQLKNLVKDELEQMQGVFRLGVIPTVTPYLVPLFISDFVKQHADTKLEVHELQSAEIIKRLQTDQLDLGILATPLNEPELREVPVFYEPFLIFADEENQLLKQKGALRVEDLGPDGLWLLEQGHCFRNHTLNLCQFDGLREHRSIVMEGGSIETLKQMIKRVGGYTLIPELSFNPTLDAEYVVRFREPEPVREISIVVHKNFTRELLITELRKSIIRHTPDSFRKNQRFITVKWR